MSKPDKQQYTDALTTSKDVIESYVFSTSGRDFSVYSERLLLQLVEIAQKELAGASFKEGFSLSDVQMTRLSEAKIQIPITALLSSADDNNYNRAKTAVMELMHSPYTIERPKINSRTKEVMYDKDGRIMYEFIARQILNGCNINTTPGMIDITVNPDTWRAILDFSKGFRKYDLIACRKLRKSSSMRMFRLLSNQTNPITYTIKDLREMWSVGEDKYKDTSDFIRRMIAPAKEELDKVAPWSFDYVTNTAYSAEENKGRRGRKVITSVTFFPKSKAEHLSDEALIKRASSYRIVDKELTDMLIKKFGFTMQSIKSNIMLFEAANKVGMDVKSFLDKISPRALRANNSVGYVVNSMKKALMEEHNVRIESDKLYLDI